MRILLNTVYSIEFAQFYFRVFVKEIIFPYSIIHGNQADLKTKCPGIVEFAVEAYNKRGKNKTAKITRYTVCKGIVCGDHHYRDVTALSPTGALPGAAGMSSTS